MIATKVNLSITRKKVESLALPGDFSCYSDFFFVFSIKIYMHFGLISLTHTRLWCVYLGERR